MVAFALSGLWLLGTILIGSLGALGIASFFVPSLANFVATMFSSLFAAFRQMVQFMVDMLPKPLKILIFIGLISVLGASVYSFTYGAQFVCDSGVVKQVDWLTGLTYKMAAAPGVNWETLDSTAVPVDVGVNGTPATQNGVASTDVASNIFKHKDVVYNGVPYSTISAIMPRAALQTTTMSLIPFLIANDTQIWNQLRGADAQIFGSTDNSYISFQLCRDSATSTCTLERSYSSVTGGFSGGCGGGVLNGGFQAMGNDPWQGLVGTLIYTYTPSGIDATFNNGGLKIFGVGIDASSCKLIDQSKINSLIYDSNGNPLNTGYADAYRLVFAGNVSPNTVHVQTSGLLGSTIGSRSLDIAIYDSSYTLIYHNESGSVEQTAQYTLQANGQINDTRLCNGDKGITNWQCNRNMLLVGVPAYVNDPSSIVQITCVSPNSGDTTLKLFGVNILDPAILIALVVLGAVLSGIIYLKNLFG